jgi:homoprotocatechuate degradation regulator HpaR
MKPSSAKPAATTPSGANPTQMPRTLAGALLAAREATMAPLRVGLRVAGLTEAQWRVLRVLSVQGELNGRDLARAAVLHPPSVTRILQELTERGLVERSVSANDRRNHSINLTAQGRALIANSLVHNRRLVEHYRSVFGAERLEALLSELTAFTEAVTAHPPPARLADFAEHGDSVAAPTDDPK